MKIRRAHADDANRLLELWSELSAAGHEADRRYQIKQGADQAMAESIKVWLTDDQPAWVAEVRGEIAGFIVARPAPAHPVLDTPSTLVVTDAYVAAPFRRNGVGSLLFDPVNEHAESLGITVIEVGTLAFDARAIEFWRNHGFTDWRVTMSRGSTHHSTESTR